MAAPAAIVPPLVLASGSPRRHELLRRAGVSFEIQLANLAEDALPGELPAATARRLAAEKALAVARRLPELPPRLVLGADTLVVRDGTAIGKPESPEHALEILESLVGRSHEVVTGVAIARSDERLARGFCHSSLVQMRAASRDELRAYIATGEPLDKAGAYALQGEGQRLVSAVLGNQSNVIGLPLEQRLALLRGAGLHWEPA
jgi:septum formation protein